jgi:hypothetical protein
LSTRFIKFEETSCTTIYAADFVRNTPSSSRSQHAVQMFIGTYQQNLEHTLPVDSANILWCLRALWDLHFDDPRNVYVQGPIWSGRGTLERIKGRSLARSNILRRSTWLETSRTTLPLTIQSLKWPVSSASSPSGSGIFAGCPNGRPGISLSQFCSPSNPMIYLWPSYVLFLSDVIMSKRMKRNVVECTRLFRRAESVTRTLPSRLAMCGGFVAEYTHTARVQLGAHLYCSLRCDMAKIILQGAMATGTSSLSTLHGRTVASSTQSALLVVVRLRRGALKHLPLSSLQLNLRPRGDFNIAYCC